MPLHCIEFQLFTIVIFKVIVGHDEGKLLFSLDFLDILAQSNAILQLLLVQGVGICFPDQFQWMEELYKARILCSFPMFFLRGAIFHV